MGARSRAIAVALALAALLAAPPASSARPAVQLSQPDYSVYHTREGLVEAYRAVVARCPSVMRLETRFWATPDGAYNASVDVVAVEPGGLPPAGSPPDPAKARLLLSFGEHGRELVSPEVGLRVLELLCDARARAALAPDLAPLGVPPAALEALLARTSWRVLPLENDAGRRAVQAGALCERRNGRGVDPNRNWDAHWGHREADYDPKEEFPGAAPFSEPEARLVRDEAAAFRPHVWLAVHSGMEALFLPHDHRPELAEGPAPAAALAALRALNAALCGGRCAVGPGGRTVGYFAHGTATDWMSDTLRVPVAMTWEVYGDAAAPYEDCFRMFNPLTAAGLEAVVRRWGAAVLGLVGLLPTVPGVPLGGGDGAPPEQAAAAAGQPAAAAAGAEDGGGGAGGGGGGAPPVGADAGAQQQEDAEEEEQQQEEKEQQQQQDDDDAEEEEEGEEEEEEPLVADDDDAAGGAAEQAGLVGPGLGAALPLDPRPSRQAMQHGLGGGDGGAVAAARRGVGLQLRRGTAPRAALAAVAAAAAAGAAGLCLATRPRVRYWAARVGLRKRARVRLPL